MHIQVSRFYIQKKAKYNKFTVEKMYITKFPVSIVKFYCFLFGEFIVLTCIFAKKKLDTINDKSFGRVNIQIMWEMTWGSKSGEHLKPQ